MISDRNGPPSFEEAKNKRQKVRAAGMDPNYWYAVEWDRTIKKGEVKQVRFWRRPVALYRGQDGRLRAIDDRCAHRQLPLSKGIVEGEKLVCEYHGWKFNGAGELTEVSHELFGRKMPRCKLTSYPIRVRYGLIWIFFGDPELADSVSIPDIPELIGKSEWTRAEIDVTWKCHHSMIIDNVSDFTHAFLHRKYQPFVDSKLTKVDERDDKVYVHYETKVGRGKISGLFVDRSRVDTEQMDLCYHYPYQCSNTGDAIKHWLFVLPIDERTTRAFFIFYFKPLKVPFLPVSIPKPLMVPLMAISNEVLIKPLLDEDRRAVEAEQEGYEEHFAQPIAELSPAVHAFQELTVRKWQAYLDREQAKIEQRVANAKTRAASTTH
jgi:phenylpropionate dioxygenase-like ring-hydroxylating dioxygenase large terminal subunit